MATSPNGTRLPFKLPSDPDQLIQWLEAKRHLGKPVTTPAAMKLNLAFVLGYQWLVWDQRNNQYVRVENNTRDANRPVRLKMNKITTLVERSIAKATKEAPIPEARPASDDDDDVSSAKVASRILTSEMDRLDWDKWLQKFMFWPYTLGWSYAMVGWDPGAGDVLGTDPDDADSNVFTGEITLEEVPAYQLSVDPASASMSDAKWAVRSTTMTAEEVWVKWDVEVEGGQHNDLSREVHQLGGTQTDKSAGDWVTVHQAWIRPGKVAPKGAVITWVNQQVLEHKAYPFDHGMLPFVQCNCLPGIGTREGRTFVTDLIDPQTDYNDSLSREATIRRQLTPKLISAVGQINTATVTSRVEHLQYNPGVAPNPPSLEVPSPAWAQQFETGMARNEADMGERAGIGDASAGDAASSAPAASILALQDADDTKLRLTITEMSNFIASIGRHVLLLAKQYWSEERTVRVWSQEDILDAYRYRGADIDDRVDIHLSSESSMPRSKAARTQMVMQLAQMYPQLIDPQDVMRFLDMPGLDFFVRSLDVDTRKQARENSQMLQGQDCKVQPFDNHAAHLKVLNDFRKSIDYEQLPIEEQARFDAHAAVHESLVLQQLGLANPSPQPTQDPAAMQQAQQAIAGPAAAPTDVPSSDPTQAPPPAGGPPGSEQSIRQQAGIAQQAGQPGAVPGIPADMQAQSMGG